MTNNTPKRSPILMPIRFLGSLHLAVALMAVLAVVMAWTTLFAEQKYGTPAVEFGVYFTWWFYGLQGLIALNLLVSMLLRFPWQRRHFGFLLSHGGIIVLLVGCWLTSQYGIEANMQIFEGQSSHVGTRSKSQHFALDVADHNAPASDDRQSEADQSATIDVPFVSGPFNWNEYRDQLSLIPWQLAHRDQGVLYDQDGIRLDVLDYLADGQLVPVESLCLRVHCTPVEALLEAENVTTVEDPTETTDETSAEDEADAVEQPAEPQQTAEPQWFDVDLAIRPQPSGMQAMGMMSSMGGGKSVQKALPDATQLVYWMSDDPAESAAFQACKPPEQFEDGSVWGEIVLCVNPPMGRDSLSGDQESDDGPDNKPQNVFRFSVDQLIENSARLQAELAHETSDEKRAEIEAQLQHPLGDTGLTIELDRFMPQMPAVMLMVREQNDANESDADTETGDDSKAETTSNAERLRVFATMPWMSTPAKRHGVYGAFFVDGRRIAEQASNLMAPDMLALVDARRIEMLLDTKQQMLAWRAIDYGRADSTGTFDLSDYGTTPQELTFEAFTGRHDNGENNNDTNRNDGNSVDTPVEVQIAAFQPHDLPGYRLQPVSTLTKAPRGVQREPWVKLQTLIDGIEETFWLKKTQPGPPDDFAQHTIHGKDRNLNVTLAIDEIDLGFELYLRRFQRKLDPGSPKPASFSSWVDLMNPVGEETDKVEDAGHTTDANTADVKPIEDIKITLNHPPIFADPNTGRPYRVYQSSFDGPFKPGDPQFDYLVGGRVLRGEETPRDEIYMSVFSANYDPGRSFKYLGSLMIVLGTIVLFYGRRSRKSSASLEELEKSLSTGESEANTDDTNTTSRTGNSPFIAKSIALFIALSVSTALGGSLFGTPIARADDSQLNWSRWRSMPVFHDSRIMPLGTYSRLTVESICGDPNPTFTLDETALKQVPDELRERLIMLIRDGGRQFESHELIFSWLAEPGLWDYVPMLPAENQKLREDYLGLTVDKDSNPASQRFASPTTLQKADDFWPLLNESLTYLQTPKEDRKELPAEQVELYKAASQLNAAYMLYCHATYNPHLYLPQRAVDKLDESFNHWRGAAQLWSGLQTLTSRTSNLQFAETFEQDFAILGQGVRQLTIGYRGDPQSGTPPKPPTVEITDLMLGQMTALADDLQQQAESIRKTAYELSPDAIDGITPDQFDRFRGQLHSFAFQIAQMADMLDQANLALYDNGKTLLVMPALNPRALSASREPGDDTQPWLSLQTLVFGSDALVRRYANPELPKFTPTGPPPMYRGVLLDYLKESVEQGNPDRKVRSAFYDAVSAYASRKLPARAERFDAAMQRLADAIADYAQAIEPERAKMPIRDRDDLLLKQTAYPSSSGQCRIELFYYDFNPFFWTLATCILALLAFIVSALSSSWSGKRSDSSHAAKQSATNSQMPQYLFWTGIAMLVLTVLISVFGMSLRAYITGWVPVTNMYETIIFVAWLIVLFGLWFALQPVFGSGVKEASARTALKDGQSGRLRPIVVWFQIVLTAICLFVVWKLSYTPSEHAALDAETYRLVIPSLTTLSGLIDQLVVYTLIGLIAWYASRLLLVLSCCCVTVPAALRRGETTSPTALHAIIGAATAAVAYTAGFAAFGPDFDSNIKPLVAVLRDNYWLTFHVFTIAAGYAAGLLAWMLGVIALGAYMFGQYHLVDGRVQSPKMCDLLSRYIYRTMQAAILMIAIGTITGARWADFSWGRFWSWDPKEVWALITLFVYLAILHGRLAGYFKNFGLAVGVVTGAIAIVLTWYGINYVFGGGRHSYGSGESSVGTWVMIGFIIFNVALPLFATIVYTAKKSLHLESK